MTAEDYPQAAALVTEECHRALTAIEPEKVLEYLDMLTSAKRVFFVGVGRVLLSLEAIAKRYAHLGIDTVIVGQLVPEVARLCSRQESQERPKHLERKSFI